MIALFIKKLVGEIVLIVNSILVVLGRVANA